MVPIQQGRGRGGVVVVPIRRPPRRAPPTPPPDREICARPPTQGQTHSAMREARRVESSSKACLHKTHTHTRWCHHGGVACRNQSKLQLSDVNAPRCSGEHGVSDGEVNPSSRPASWDVAVGATCWADACQPMRASVSHCVVCRAR